LHFLGERVCVECGDGGWLRLVEVEIDGVPADADVLQRALGEGPIPLANVSGTSE
jgi:hypothetical protein